MFLTNTNTSFFWVLQSFYPEERGLDFTKLRFTTQNVFTSPIAQCDAMKAELMQEKDKFFSNTSTGKLLFHGIASSRLDLNLFSLVTFRSNANIVRLWVLKTSAFPTKERFGMF